MGTLFAAAFMNQASQSQGLGQGAGIFVVADSATMAGSCAADSAIPSPMISSITDPEKVPPNCRRI